MNDIENISALACYQDVLRRLKDGHPLFFQGKGEERCVLMTMKDYFEYEKQRICIKMITDEAKGIEDDPHSPDEAVMDLSEK